MSFMWFFRSFLEPSYFFLKLNDHCFDGIGVPLKCWGKTCKLPTTSATTTSAMISYGNKNNQVGFKKSFNLTEIHMQTWIQCQGFQIQKSCEV